jgi:hypothetical protein
MRSGTDRLAVEIEYIKWLARTGRLKDIAPFAAKLGKKIATSRDQEARLALALGEFEQLERDLNGVARLREEAVRIVAFADQEVRSLPSHTARTEPARINRNRRTAGRINWLSFIVSFVSHFVTRC